MNKEYYIEKVRKNFTGKTLEIILNQIDLFFQKDVKINKTKYSENDLVMLKKGTFLHGIFRGKDVFDHTKENGFISVDFTDESRPNKICNSVGMWNIQEDMLLKDYIINYSGFTITYSIGRGPGSKKECMLIPYHKFDEVTEMINDREDVWQYWGDKTKEVSFIPSLVSNKRQIAFILNMESDYAKKMAYNDVWNLDFDEEILKPFLDYRYIEKFINEDRINKDASTTDRESAIIFGLPPSLIEGVFVGREVESNSEILEYIKNKLPDCYICNLDGKVIVGNK